MSSSSTRRTLAWAGVQALAKGLHKLTPGHLFSILVPVFMSLAIIRMTARILRAAFPASQLTRVIERVVSWLAWCGVILWELGILPMVWDELDSIHFKLGSNRLTVAVMIEGLLTASVVLMLALWVSAALERRLLRGAEADHLSLRKIVAKLLRAGLLTVGMLVALSTAGIDITALGVLGGALGVGLGFGGCFGAKPRRFTRGRIIVRRIAEFAPAVTRTTGAFTLIYER